MQQFLNYHKLDCFPRISAIDALQIMQKDMYHLSYIHYFYPNFNTFQYINDKIYYHLYTCFDSDYIIADSYYYFNHKLLDYQFILSINNTYILFTCWPSDKDKIYINFINNNIENSIIYNFNTDNIDNCFVSRISNILQVDSNKFYNQFYNYILKIKSIILLLDI